MEALIPTIFEELDQFLTPRSRCCSPSDSALSVSEDAHRLFIEAPMPGVPSDKIEVTLDPKKRTLSITGKNEEAREGAHYHMRGRNAFFYEVPLTSAIDMDGKIRAKAKDGLLTVTLTKSKREKPMKIDVKVS